MPDSKLPSICFVAPNAFPLLAGDQRIQLIGGAELQQVTVARALGERGHEVSMICLDFGQPDQIAIDGVKVFRAFRPDEGVPGLRFVWPRLTSIWRCLASADADIYYQRTAGMLTGVMAAFCQRAGKKSIFAAAGNPDLELRTSRIRFARDHWIYEYGLRNVDRIIVQNEEQQRLCRVNFARDATLIPNCYPVNQSRPASAPDLVLWVSTIRRLKRPHFFLDLAEALPGFRFRMIGGPDSAEVALFEAVKQRAAMMANVEFLGFVPYSGIDTHFDEAAVFVNTSESEGFPNTFLQAWARAVPTVSFVDSGARAEGHPVGVQVGSIKAVTEQVALWLENETKRHQDGRRCRDYFERHHTPGLVLELYEQIFRELATNQ